MRKSRTGAFESFFTFDTRESGAVEQSVSHSQRSERSGAHVRQDGMFDLSGDANQERAVLVSVPQHPDRRDLDWESDDVMHPELEELFGLASAAGVRVCDELVQIRQTPDPATFLGSGKVAELRELVDQSMATLVLFDQDLSPGQSRNLEKILKVRVLDRTELILDIFATRARTTESKLAVELAQLEYSLPRLKRLWTHLERQTKGGVGLRGPGEKQLETDRRIAEKRISELKRALETVQVRRQREASGRSDRMTVSLVGYTNAGKSTLMNQLTGAGVPTEDSLFCTLDTRTRRWSLPGWGPVLLSDTVGFIRDLPHHLIASFRATLEEARQAHLLLHVADASNPSVFDQVSAAYAVLSELGIQSKDTILVLNKMDAVTDSARIDALCNRYAGAFGISASTGEGISELTAAVSERLSDAFLDLEVVARVDQGRLFHDLATHGEVISRQWEEDVVRFHVRISQKFVGWLRGVALEVHPYGHPEMTLAQRLGEEV